MTTPTASPSMRLATPADIPRLAFVATAGFGTSPQFHWERPYNAQYPKDTYIGYAALFAKLISDDAATVVLVEDHYDAQNENRMVAETGLTTDDLYRAPREGKKAAVAVAAWTHSFISGAELFSGLLDPEDDSPSTPELQRGIEGYEGGGPKRDVRIEHRQQLREQAVAKWKEHSLTTLPNLLGMDMLAVHPTYRGRGHARRLASLGPRVADAKEMPMALIAQPDAVKLYLTLGFEIVGEVVLEDGEEKLVLKVMVRKAVATRR